MRLRAVRRWNAPYGPSGWGRVWQFLHVDGMSQLEWMSQDVVPF